MRPAFALLLLLPVAAVRGAEAPTDEELLQKARVGIDSPALLDFFRQRTATEAVRERVAGLIAQLGDERFPVREKAAKDLRALGLPAVALLRQSLDNPDEETRDQARYLIAAIEDEAPPALAAAAVRLLRKQKPAGTITVLLGYAPFVQDEMVEREVLETLVTLGVREGKIDPVLPPALKDKAPARRAAAAMVLGRSGTAEQKAAVRELLTDADPRVRLRAAQGLVAGRDKSGVPGLVALLEGPADMALEAEDLLHCLAGARAPRVAPGETPATRRRCRDAWALWWKGQEKGLDLARADADLTWFNTSLRLREGTRAFFAALNAGDPAALEQVTEVPFSIPGQQVFQRQEELNMFLANIMNASRQQNVTYSLRGIATLDEYLRTAPRPEKDFLGKLRRADVRVAYVQVTQNGQPQPQGGYVRAVYLRVSTSRARVFGFGQGGPPQPVQ